MKSNLKFNFVLLLVNIIIIISSILIGSPLKYNVQTLNLIISILFLIIIVVNTKNKEKIINNRLDFVIIILLISSIIPLIFNTYISLEETIDNIFTYTSLVSIYFIVKELLKKNKERNITIIIKTIIISGIIIFIFGIDNLTINFFGDFFNKVGILEYQNEEVRMIANIGYANTVGIIMAVCSILSVGLHLKQKQSSIIEVITNFIFLVGLLLSESKGSLVIYLFVLILYYFFNKRAKNRAKILVMTITTVITGYMYYLIFCKYMKNIAIVYGGLILFIILTGIIYKFASMIITKRLQKVIYKINRRKIIITIISIIIVISLIFVILIQFTKSLELFKEKNSGLEDRQTIRNIEPNKEYKIEFDLDANTKENNENTYLIQIDEENKYDQPILSHYVYVGSFEGKKEIDITTTSDTTRITILYQNILPQNANGLVINKLTVNEKNIPVDYRFITKELVSNMQGFTLSNKNLWERLVFIKDGIKLASENWITGIGGNGWMYKYEEIQSYAYSAKQSHCYLTQMWIENGILGLLSIIIIFIIVLKNLIKNKNDSNIILFGLTFLLIFLHSLMDFDLSFYYNKLILFIVIGIISSYLVGYAANKKIKIFNVLSIMVLALFSIFTLVENGKIIYIHGNIENIDSIEEVKSFSKVLPYSLELQNKEIEILLKNERKNEAVLKLEEINDSTNNIQTYESISDIAITQLKDGDKESGIKNLQKACMILSKETKKRNIKLEKYEEMCEIVLKNCEELQSELNNYEIIKMQYELIINIVNESKKNVQEYDITRKSKDEFIEIKNKLEGYKKDAEKYIYKEK